MTHQCNVSNSFPGLTDPLMLIIIVSFVVVVTGTFFIILARAVRGRTQ